MNIGFNKPYLSGRETAYIADAVERRKISGDGDYTKACHRFFEARYHFHKVLLTTSCTDALEMAAILLDIRPGDEVIIPSYTFVSSANPFILRGASVVFADSGSQHPNIDASGLEKLITARTKAIVVVHYAGIACEMDAIMTLAGKHDLFVIEDAAQAIDGYYKDRPLGSIGHIGCFSFHETKNIISGEGGLLVINDKQFAARAEVIWEKGTNRSAFNRNEVKKYEWIDIGSSFLPSELTAAFLYAQLENLDDIQQRRSNIWNYYYDNLKNCCPQLLPLIPSHSSNNYHIFYLVCKDLAQQQQLRSHLLAKGIQAITHYLALHRSPYFTALQQPARLENAERFADCIIRLPFYYELSTAEQDYIIEQIQKFFVPSAKQAVSLTM